MDAQTLAAVAEIVEKKGDVEIALTGVARNRAKRDVVLMTEDDVKAMLAEYDDPDEAAKAHKKLLRKANVTILGKKDLADEVKVVCISKECPFDHEGQQLQFGVEYELPRHVAELMATKRQVHIIDARQKAATAKEKAA